MNTNDTDVAEARRAAAMWQERCRESEEAHARDAAVLKALRDEVERLRAPAPAGGTDREAELDRIAAAQRERMAPSSTESDAVPAGYVASIRITRDAPAADLDAARAAAREARERAGKATPGPWRTVANGEDGRFVRSHGFMITEVRSWDCAEENAAFIAAARSDVPTLAAHVEALADETERLRARVVELEAERERAVALDADRAIWDLAREQRADATAPHAVAALLAAVDARAAEAALDGGSFESGRSTGLEDAARLITDHLGAPLPLDRVVAEVVALSPKDVHGVDRGPDLSPAECAAMAIRLLRAKGGRFPPTVREKMSLAARVLLAGIQACDAPAPVASCPSALMHSTLGRLPCNVRGPHAQHVSATGERWGSEGVAEHPDFDTRAFFDDGSAKGGA